MSTCEEKSSDPGAARFGNFINYYEFNPSAKRLCHLPNDLLRNILKLDDDPTNKAPIRCLDIGCNTGVWYLVWSNHLMFEMGPWERATATVNGKLRNASLKSWLEKVGKQPTDTTIWLFYANRNWFYRSTKIFDKGQPLSMPYHLFIQPLVSFAAYI